MIKETCLTFSRYHFLLHIDIGVIRKSLVAFVLLMTVSGATLVFSPQTALASTYTYTNGLGFGTDINGNVWNIWQANGSNVWDWHQNYVGGYLHYTFKIHNYPGYYCSGSCRYHNVWSKNPNLGFETSDVLGHDVGIFPESAQNDHTYQVDIQWNATGYHASVYDVTAGSQYSDKDYAYPVDSNTYDSWTWGYSLWSDGYAYMDEDAITHASQWTSNSYQDGTTGTTGGGGDIRTDALPVGLLAETPIITEFSAGINDGVSFDWYPYDITAGSDGNLWYTDYFSSRIGRITPAGVVTEFSTGISANAGLRGITAGTDGNVWFTEEIGNRIGQITPAGVVTEFSAGISANAGLQGITAGPDGNLWFTETDYFSGRIGRINSAKVVTEFSTNIRLLKGITVGPDGNLWFTRYSSIGRITPSGVVTEFKNGFSTNAGAWEITAGPDGNLWFTEIFGDRIGRITQAGVITEFSAGITPGAGPSGITAGPDGNLWFTEVFGKRIGRITPGGVVTEFSAGISGQPENITVGPDGNLWFTEAGGWIGRITISGSRSLTVVNGGNGTVTSYPDGINCGATCSAPYASGTPVTLTTTPDPGYSFAGWSGGGCQGTGSCQVTTDTGISVTAFFVPKNSSSLKVNIPSGITGEPLRGASVSLDGQPLTTDAGGAVIFTEISLGEHDIAIQKAGFEPVAAKVNVSAAGINKMTWSLIPVKTGSKPVVTDVSSYYTGRDKKAFFLEGVDFTISFKASVNWNGKQPGQIRFTTPRYIYNEASGSHTFNMGADFGPGGRLQVVAISADGVSSDSFDANIEVMPKPSGMLLNPDLKYSNNDFSYHIILTGGITELVPTMGSSVPDSIPMFGGKDYSFKALVDFEAEVGSDGTATYKLLGKKSSDDAFKIAGVNVGLEGGVGGEIVFKYQEDSNRWVFDAGYVSFNLMAQKDVGPAYQIVLVGPIPVPVYFRGEIEAGVQNGRLGFSGWSEGNGWQIDGLIEPGFQGRAIAGVGVAHGLSVEGYLGLGGALEIGFPDEPYLRDAFIDLSGGITATFLIGKYEKPLLEYKWSLSDNSSQSLSRGTLESIVPQEIRTLDWQPIPRNYGSGLSGGRQAMGASRAVQEAIPGEQIIPGQANIFPYSYPSLISMGNDLLLAWVTDDLTKTANNRTSVVYSRYTNGQWTTPDKIGEDGTADYYPSLAPMTGGAVAIWQDTGMVLGDQATMADVMTQQEIAVSLFNAAANTWTAPMRLTTNSYLDRSPLVAASEDKAVAVWIGNEQNDMFGSPTKPNTIFYATFNGASWSQAQTIATGIGAILKSALTYRGNTATYVFTVDGDGDISTLTDQDLYATTYDGSAWSVVTRLTADSVQDTNPQLADDASGDQLLVWYADGKFQMAGNLDMANSAIVFTPGLSSGAADFRLVSGNNGQLFIVWPDASPKGQDIYMAPYDPTLNVWGRGMMVTNTDSMERTLTAVQMPDGKVAVIYNRVETIITPRDVEVGGKTVTMNVPGPGETDLCMSAFALEGDLAVKENGLTVLPSIITPGAALTFNAGIVNRGLKPVQNIAVDFYYGDPANGGVLIGQRQTIVGPLAAGEETHVSVTWTAPQTSEAKGIYVVVDPALSIEDKDRTNNAAHIAVFQSDLAITQAYGQTVGPVKRGLTISVTNIGLVAAQNIPLSIKKDDANGSMIYEELIDELAPGEKRDVAYEWNTSGLIATDGYLKVYAEANGDRTISESSYLNNARTIQVLVALPGEVANPGIQNGATNVSIPPQFSWQMASGATAYDLYLWKEGDARPSTPSAKDVIGVAATISFPLSPFTTYHWQIVAKNTSGQMEGPEWTFTTGYILVGDLNGDTTVNLLDAILALQAIAGLNPSGVRANYVASGVDVNNDGKVGLAEAVYITQKVAGMR